MSLGKLRTEENGQVLGAILAIHTHQLQNGLDWELFFHFFCGRNFSVTFRNRAWAFAIGAWQKSDEGSYTVWNESVNSARRTAVF